MKKIFCFIALLALLVSCASTEQSDDMSSMMDNTEVSEMSWEMMNHSWDTMDDMDAMKKSLSDSPRHQEWVEIDNNGKTIHAFVVYPENKEKSAAVVMIHENKWLNDWARNMADQIAAEWYIVIAPDLLSSFDASRQKTSDFISPDDATQALYSLDQDAITSDLQAVAQYAKSIESSNWNLVSAWFCWGGSQSFRLASQKDDFQASFVFYGTAPEDEVFYENIDIPVYWFYAENDDRVNATIEATEENMTKNENIFEYEIYDGVGHAFMRQADAPDADDLNKEAKNAALERMLDILSEYK